MYKNAAREKKPRNTVRKRGKRGRALLNGADKRHGRHTNGIASSQATLQADMRQRIPSASDRMHMPRTTLRSEIY